MRTSVLVDRRRLLAIAIGLLFALSWEAKAESLTGVDLSLIPGQEKIRIGQIVKVRLFAESATGQELSVDSVQSIISWDPTKLLLLGVSANDPPLYPWLSAGFNDDSAGDNLNNGVNSPPFGVPFNDGDAFFQSQSQLAPPVGVGPAIIGSEGLKVIRFAFQGIGETLSTPISLVPQIGQTVTGVFLTGAPGANVLRSLTSTHIRVNVPEPASVAMLAGGLAVLLRRRRS